MNYNTYDGLNPVEWMPFKDEICAFLRCSFRFFISKTTENHLIALKHMIDNHSVKICVLNGVKYTINRNSNPKVLVFIFNIEDCDKFLGSNADFILSMAKDKVRTFRKCKECKVFDFTNLTKFSPFKEILQNVMMKMGQSDNDSIVENNEVSCNNDDNYNESSNEKIRGIDKEIVIKAAEGALKAYLIEIKNCRMKFETLVSIQRAWKKRDFILYFALDIIFVDGGHSSMMSTVINGNKVNPNSYYKELEKKTGVKGRKINHSTFSSALEFDEITEKSECVKKLLDEVYVTVGIKDPEED